MAVHFDILEKTINLITEIIKENANEFDKVAFQHDGAPPHDTREVENYSYNSYREPTEWTARRPDLTF